MTAEAEVEVWEWHWEMHPYVMYCTTEISLTTLLSFLVSSWKAQRGFHIFNEVLSMQKCMFGHISKKSENLFKMSGFLLQFKPFLFLHIARMKSS